MKKAIAAGLALILLFNLGCAPEKKRFQAEFLTLFNTVTRIVGYAQSEEEFRNLAQKIYDELLEYHQLYDIYHDYEGVNNLKTINDNAGIAPVAVDARIIDMLEFARKQCERSGGRVNVALGGVFKIWHDYRQAGTEDPENAELPPMNLLKEAAQHADIDDLVIDRVASTVFLKDAKMHLDCGAIAKGYAVEQVALYLEDLGVESLLLSVGGNIRAIGERAQPDDKGEKRWMIGIQNPDKSSEQKELLVVRIAGLSVVSSGVYERYYTVEGRRYHHVIDPETLMPSAYFDQVTILCQDSGLADALSTAIFNMPLEEGKAYIENLDGAEALWVLKDGSLQYSSGFMDYVKTD
ncbi:MAG: FAD:protein FMN transferase [Christensenellales bacterium]|jgi:thiamine biosynthesis lipoprotein